MHLSMPLCCCRFYQYMKAGNTLIQYIPTLGYFLLIGANLKISDKVSVMHLALVSHTSLLAKHWQGIAGPT